MYIVKPCPKNLIPKTPRPNTNPTQFKNPIRTKGTGAHTKILKDTNNFKP